MKDNYTAMRSCPKFNTCSAPLCPLDPKMNKRYAEKPDPKCTLPRATREKLGKKLKNKGMFKKELTGKNTWNSKSKEDKTKHLTRLKTYQF